MINLTLIALLIHFAFQIIFKPKNNSLSCGLFCWLGNDADDFSPDKFNMLGVFNDSRGGDSCGIYSGGDITIGIRTEERFAKLLSTYMITNEDLHIPLVMGHTRRSSVGSITVDSAHPFGFGEVNINGVSTYEFIGAHNGTLLNHEELAKKHGIDMNDTEGKFARRKIDSQVLLEIIYKQRDIGILSEYDGAAALMWTFPEQKNTAFFFRGESSVYAKNGYKTSERPLFYYQEGPNSLYVSSLENSLRAIGATKEQVIEFDTNIVYKVVDGNMSTAVKYKVNRDNCVQKSTYANAGYRQHGYPVNGYNNKSSTKSTLNSRVSDKKSLPVKKLNLNNIFNEESRQNEKGSKLYFHKLRYYRSGHLVNGVFTWIKGSGFNFISMTSENLNKVFAWKIGARFKDGHFNTSTKEDPEAYIPFPNDEYLGTNKLPKLFYFTDGIRVASKDDFDSIVALKGTRHSFTWEDISHCSTHPIMNIDRINVRDVDQNIIHRGEVFNGNIAVLGGDRIYEIKDGNCINISEYVESSIDYTSIEKANKEASMAISQVSVVPEELSIEDEIVIKLVSDVYADAIIRVSEVIGELKDFKGNKLADDTRDLFTNFMEDAYELIKKN